MRAILIPVKTFSESKQRLERHYSVEQRTALAAALCSDFFRVVSRVRGIDRVLVVSAEPRALRMAEQYEWETMEERKQISESHSVDFASHICAQRGVRALLRLPIDIPLARPADIEVIIGAIEDIPSCIIVPSHDEKGTNALLRAPPTLFPSHFGPDSFTLHLKEAQRCRARVKILHNVRIALDLDGPGDLHAISNELRSDSATAKWLRDIAGTDNTNGTDLARPGG